MGLQRDTGVEKFKTLLGNVSVTQAHIAATNCWTLEINQIPPKPRGINYVCWCNVVLYLWFYVPKTLTK